MRAFLLLATLLVSSAWDPLDPRWCLYRRSAPAQRELLDFLATSPHFFSSVRLAPSPSDGGLRVLAARALKRGEVALRIGAEHALSARTAFADASFGAEAAALYSGAAADLSAEAAAALREDPERRVAFVAWLHREVFLRNGTSPWAPLLRALPCAAEVAHLPLLWGAGDLAAAMGAPLLGPFLAERLALQNLTLGALRGTFWRGDAAAAGARRVAEHAWVEAMHDSRAYGAADPVDALKLLPLIDMFNHAAGAPAPVHTLRPFDSSSDVADPPLAPTWAAGGGASTGAAAAARAPSRRTHRMAHYAQAAHADLREGEEVFSNYDGASGGGGGGGRGGRDACAFAKLISYGFAGGNDCGALTAADWAAGCGTAAAGTLRAGRRQPTPPGIESIVGDVDAAVGGGGGGGRPWEISVFAGDARGLASAAQVAHTLSAPVGDSAASSLGAVAACLGGTARAAAERTRAARAAAWARWEAGQPGLSPKNAFAVDAVFAGALRAVAYLEREAHNASASFLGVAAVGGAGKAEKQPSLAERRRAKRRRQRKEEEDL